MHFLLSFNEVRFKIHNASNVAFKIWFKISINITLKSIMVFLIYIYERDNTPVKTNDDGNFRLIVNITF